MMHSSTEGQLDATNGAAVTPTAATAPCPLNELPQSAHEFIHKLSERIAELETTLENFHREQEKNRNRMKGLGKVVLSGPGKMFIAALPKEMQADIQEFFGVTP